MSTTYEPYNHSTFDPSEPSLDAAPEEQDELEELEAAHGADDETAAEQAGKKPEAKPASRKRSGPDRGLIRRVAKKVVELQEADEQDVQLLASLLGSSSEDVTELTLAVMTSSRGDTAALADVKEIAEANEAERAVQALTMGKPRMKAVWGVLAALGAVNATMPASDAKAALALAGATIDDAVIARLDRVSELAKRGW